jgi:dTDP-4-dehydrorhamnose 3,5-epimerase-like enzyme
MIFKKPRYISYKKFTDKKGYLIPFEALVKKNKRENMLPIKIKRIFFSSGKKRYFRGNHAHKKCSQFLICLNGVIKVETIHKKEKNIFNLSAKNKRALLLPPMVWNRIFFIKDNSLLGVICDYKYDNKNEYINSFEKFVELSNK